MRRCWLGSSQSANHARFPPNPVLKSYMKSPIKSTDTIALDGIKALCFAPLTMSLKSKEGPLSKEAERPEGAVGPWTKRVSENLRSRRRRIGSGAANAYRCHMSPAQGGWDSPLLFVLPVALNITSYCLLPSITDLFGLLLTWKHV